MGVNYNRLWKMMIDKNISKTELTHLAGITTNAMAKLGKNQDVRLQVLEKLCTSLDCKLYLSPVLDCGYEYEGRVVR